MLVQLTRARALGSWFRLRGKVLDERRGGHNLAEEMGWREAVSARSYGPLP